MQLHVKAFAITFSLIWGLAVFLFTWWIIFWEGSTGERTLIGQIYRGYNISPTGSFIGLAWGLADGFIGGWLSAMLYNFLARKLRN